MSVVVRGHGRRGRGGSWIELLSERCVCLSGSDEVCIYTYMRCSSSLQMFDCAEGEKSIR